LKSTDDAKGEEVWRKERITLEKKKTVQTFSYMGVVKNQKE